MNDVMKSNTSSNAHQSRINLADTISANVLARAITNSGATVEPTAVVPATKQVALKPVVLRKVIGEELRRHRSAQHRTLREVAKVAQVSLGYLSEVERGQKEASSELLGAICRSLEISLSVFLADVAVAVARQEQQFAYPPTELS